MNINKVIENLDESERLSFKEACERYAAGTLDDEAKSKMDQLAKSISNSFAEIAAASLPAMTIAAERAKEFESSIKAHAAAFTPALDQIAEFYRLHVEAATTRLQATGAWIEAARSAAVMVPENFSRLPKYLREALSVIGEYGWFIDMDIAFTDIWELRDAFEAGSYEEADNALIEYFDSRLDELELSIVNRFPPRRKIIEAALKAHRDGEYELAIPVFLAQADGISKDLIGKHFFLSDSGKPATAEYVESLSDDMFTAALLSPLAIKLAINKSEKERGSNFVGLNRHLVLHGISLDYGTRTNSFKAISLLNFLAHAVDPSKAAST